jgi:hypothetical protein
MLEELKGRAKAVVGIKKSRIKMSQDAKCYSIIMLSCSFFSLSSLFTGRLILFSVHLQCQLVADTFSIRSLYCIKLNGRKTNKIAIHRYRKRLVTRI